MLRLLPLVFCVAACDQGAGSLRADWLQLDDCKARGESKRFEPFTMDLAYATVESRLGVGLVRMSPSGREIALADQVIVTLDATLDPQADIAASGSARYELTGDGQGEADLSLALMSRCAHVTQPLSARGTVTFYEYGWKTKSRIRGEMKFDLVDRRTGEVVGANFIGDFDFDGLTTSPLASYSPEDY